MRWARWTLRATPLFLAGALAALSACGAPRNAPSETNEEPPATETAAAGASLPDLRTGPCQHDRDCALSDYAAESCCTGCRPAAATRTSFEVRARACTESAHDCPALDCPPHGTERARCQSGECVLAGPPAPPPEPAAGPAAGDAEGGGFSVDTPCEADDDCAFHPARSASCCNGCEPLPWSKRALEAREARCRDEGDARCPMRLGRCPRYQRQRPVCRAGRCQAADGPVR